MKFVAAVEYLGTHFHGFQSQVGVRTVQDALQDALSQVGAEDINVFCAGRTDAGVHAKEQVIHWEAKNKRTPRAWLFGGNRFLPDDVNLVWVREAEQNFHARFDAYARQYHYLIYNHHTRSALRRHTHLWEPRELNITAMQQAAKLLVGTHDFSSFRDSQCQAKSAIKTIEFLTIMQQGDEVIIDIKANAFLHHMVRNIVGTLLKIGYGDKPVLWMNEVLEAKDRRVAGMTVPAQGLYFMRVFYPNLV